MKMYYLTDVSEKSLAPFFSQKILAANLYGVIILSGIVAAFWPWHQSLNMYLRQNRGPFVFFPAFAAALVIFAYIHLRCGRGEMVRSDFSASYLKKLSTFEIEYSFLQYGLLECVLHVAFTLLPAFPLCFLATSVSGLGLDALGKGLVIVGSAALLCRLFGFLMYVLWGRASVVGYLIARIFLVVFVFVTALNIPMINPLRLLYALNKGTPAAAAVSFISYLFVVLTMFTVLVVVNALLVKRRRRRGGEE